MESNGSGKVRFGLALFGIVTVGLVLWGWEPNPSAARIGMVHDWSHRHVVFSAPATAEHALRVQQDMRFWHQKWQRNVRQTLPAEELAFLERETDRDRDDDVFPSLDWDWFAWHFRRHRKHKAPNELKRDWSISLGPNATVGAGNYPAKFSFDINTAKCGNAAQPDFIVYNTSLNGSISQASIVAYDNLYTGCGGTVPTTYWAYNTGGAVVTSAVLSLDGSQVAFIQTSAAAANLVLLKWKATPDLATSTTPDPITIVSASQYPTCTSPCMTTLAFGGAHNDTNSSPFYDYTNDALYVGDDGGLLHKFQPVLSGVPAEITSGWPVSLTAGLFKLSSPVFDSVTGRVFVGSGSNGVLGSQLFAVDASAGTIAGTSSQLGKGIGIATGPIVDSSAGKVYVFLGNDGGSGCSGPCGAVYQFATSFTSGTGIKTVTGFGGSISMYTGSFDNAYYKSANGTGTLYVCSQGSTVFPSFPAEPVILRIPISAGTMSTSTLPGAGLGTGNLPCSPVTEVFNPAAGGADRIFVSVPSNGEAAGCGSIGSGCIMNVVITTWQPSTSYAIGQRVITPNNNLMVVVTAGVSQSGGPPAWPDVLLTDGGKEIVDGTVTWVNSGFDTTATPPAWPSNTFLQVGVPIIDTNGNLQMNITSGVIPTAVSAPTWNTTIGGVTTEINGFKWRNAGPMANFGLAVDGGTSGIVVDNVVSAGTLAGGSQIYFSPLSPSSGICGVGNGCAVQASQAKLN